MHCRADGSHRQQGRAALAPSVHGHGLAETTLPRLTAQRPQAPRTVHRQRKARGQAPRHRRPQAIRQPGRHTGRYTAPARFAGSPPTTPERAAFPFWKQARPSSAGARGRPLSRRRERCLPPATDRPPGLSAGSGNPAAGRGDPAAPAATKKAPQTRGPAVWGTPDGSAVHPTTSHSSKGGATQRAFSADGVPYDANIADTATHGKPGDPPAVHKTRALLTAFPTP